MKIFNTTLKTYLDLGGTDIDSMTYLNKSIETHIFK